MAGVRRPLGDVASAQQAQAAQQGKPLGGVAHAQGDPRLTPQQATDTYRMVDFVKAVAMRDDRGQEVRVQRIRLGAPVDRESPMKVSSIVLNGAWFDIALTDAERGVLQLTRVHVTNVVSAER